MGCLCKNLATGKVQSQTIENLRHISTTDLLNLSNIIPEHSFKDHIDASRGINVHGRHYSSDKNLDGEESTDDNKLYQPRQTRSGHSFSSIIEQSKPILKNKTESFSDMNAVPLAQARATRRGVCLAKQLGFQLSDKENQALKFAGNQSQSLKIYNLRNSTIKAGHTKKVKFRETVLSKGANTVFHSPLKTEGPPFKSCNYAILLNDPFGGISLKETQLLKS